VRRIEQDQPGSRADRSGQRLTRHAEVGWIQANGTPDSPRKCHGRGVRVVVRLKHHHFIARLKQAEHGSRDALGGAGGDQDLGVWIDVNAVEPLLV